MKKDEYIVDCGGIQPEPLEPPVEEVFIDPTLYGNKKIKEAIHLFHQEQSDENYAAACFALRMCMVCDGHLVFPADVIENTDGSTDFLFKTMDINGMDFLVAFTDQEEYEKAPASGAVSQFIDSMLENVMQQEDIAGVIINPWGEHLVLCKADIALILDMGMR